jgi:hypothetical protein
MMLQGIMSGLIQVDVLGRRGKLSLGFNESGLKVDDIVPELVVFCLNGFVIFLQCVEIPYLLLQLLDVAFLPLTKRALVRTFNVSLRTHAMTKN